MGRQSYPMSLPPDAYTPAYVPDIQYYGGSPGNEISQSTANVTNDFYPKTQVEKAELTGNEMVQDVGTPGGYIEPGAPYTPPPPDPTLTAVEPDSGASGGDPIPVTLTGSGFTIHSTVTTGGLDTPYVEFVNDTTLRLLMDPRSVPGPTDIVVTDHGVITPPVTFTFTEAT